MDEIIKSQERIKMKEHLLFPGTDVYIIETGKEREEIHLPVFDDEDGSLVLTGVLSGRLQKETEYGDYIYLEEGDVFASSCPFDSMKDVCTAGSLKAARIVINIRLLDEKLSIFNSISGEVPFSAEEVKNKVREEKDMLLFKNDPAFENVLRGIINEGKEDRFLCLLNVLELLEMICRADKGKNAPCRRFEKKRVEKVKEIRAFLLSHIEEKHTQEEISFIYNIPLTSLKECFKAIYGQPLNTFIRDFKVSCGAGLLKNTNLSVADISLRLGYSNQSKFAELFKEKMNLTPLEFRNQK